MFLVSAAYLAAEGDGVLDAGLEGVAVELDGELAGVDAGADAGVAGAAAPADDCSEVLDATSFFSSVLGAGASLPEDGFILSE